MQNIHDFWEWLPKPYSEEPLEEPNKNIEGMMGNNENNMNENTDKTEATSGPRTNIKLSEKYNEFELHWLTYEEALEVVSCQECKQAMIEEL